MATDPASKIDAAADQVAGVYAKAFLGAAESAGKVAAMVREFASLVEDVLDRFPDFERMMGSAIIADDEKIEILDRVFAGRASAELLSFLKVASNHGRLDCLRAIYRAVVRQYHEMQGVVDVTVQTATALSGVLRSEIAAQLRRALGAEPELTVLTRPELIGGAVISVGDTVYDGSVSMRLARMQSHMVEHSVEQIETNRDRFLTEPL